MMWLSPQLYALFGIPIIGPIEDPDAFYCYCKADVRLHGSPWVGGTRSIAYKGPTELKITVGSMAEAFYCIDDYMRGRAFYFGCNAIVGYERELHAWEEPMICIARGTLAILGPV